MDVGRKSEHIKDCGKEPYRTSKTAVILHLYYPQLWPEISSFLTNLEQDFDLYVSVADAALDSDVSVIKHSYPNANVYRFENRGRDIGPFLDIYERIGRHYRFICKIHSKKSTQLLNGDKWRRALLENLLGSPTRVKNIKALFDEYPEIGIVAAEGYLYSLCNNLRANSNILSSLSRKLGRDKLIEMDFFFPAGSMFWFKSDALLQMKKLKIKQQDFEIEKGQLDGTLAHAVERMIPVIASQAGYETVDTRMLQFAYDFSMKGAGTQEPGVEREHSLLFWKIDLLKRIIAERDAEIEAILTSTSWRISGFMRILADWTRSALRAITSSNK